MLHLNLNAFLEMFTEREILQLSQKYNLISQKRFPLLLETRLIYRKKGICF